MTFGTEELVRGTTGQDSQDWTSCVEQAAYEIIASHHCFHGRARSFEFDQNGDVLTIRGHVPSFYLKQVLQVLLKNLEGVERIDNQVEVVNPQGVSSVKRD
jgi:BON domain